jgi:hypothetical protein
MLGREGPPASPFSCDLKADENLHDAWRLRLREFFDLTHDIYALRRAAIRRPGDA